MMSRSVVEQEMVRILRKSSLGGSDREVAGNIPLGELGLGLDSLGLVQFVTALEKRFRIEFSDDMWTDRGQLTLRHFVDIVLESGSFVSMVTPEDSQVPFQTSAPLPSIQEKIAEGTEGHGRRREAARAAYRIFSRLVRFFYLRETSYVLAFNLLEQSPPSYPSSLNLNLREASADDAAAFQVFLTSLDYYTADKKKMDTDLFRKRLESGGVCFLALHQDQIVGVDWLTDIGYNCPFTGLKLRWPQGSWYAMELYEHPKYPGRGIGLALLAFSLEEAKKRGFQTQVTMVLSKNVKMLGAAVHLFGFKKIGEIRTRRIFLRPFSSWRMGRQSGRGGVLILREND